MPSTNNGIEVLYDSKNTDMKTKLQNMTTVDIEYFKCFICLKYRKSKKHFKMYFRIIKESCTN